MIPEPPDTWSQSQDYVTEAKFVTHLKSVNDISERAMKLIEYYHECVTNDEETRQQLLQVVAWHRQYLRGTGSTGSTAVRQYYSQKTRSQEVPDASKE